MRRSFVPVAVSALLLGACSPAQYKVNPPSPEKVQESVPESQQAGYMRILGDLRWDQLTSKQEWMKEFPDCLSDQDAWSGRWKNNPTVDDLNNYFAYKRPDGLYHEVTKRCTQFKPGGIPVNITHVNFASNSGTASKTMTAEVIFSFFDDSQRRGFIAALTEKYPRNNDGYNCSKYTCWELDSSRRFKTRPSPYSGISASPTLYTISLLDQVSIDKADL